MVPEILLDIHAIRAYVRRTAKHNPRAFASAGIITKKEEQAIKELMRDDSIIIRPADKGSGLVILNSSEYLEEIETQIADSTIYKEVQIDDIRKIKKSLKKLVDKI